MSKKFEPSHYHQLATSRGFEWLGNEQQDGYYELNTINTSNKTSWCCAKGHIWKAHYNNINQGYGCPYCSGNAPRVAEDYHNLAIKRNFEWLGPFPKNTNTKTRWRCAKNHEWLRDFRVILRNGKCPYCYNKNRKTEQDYHNLAAEKELEWIGPFPKNTKIKTYWRCSKGHEWKTRYNTIYIGSSCPHCHNKTEIAVRNILQRILGYKFPKHTRKMLKKLGILLLNQNGNYMELDCYCHELKLAFEFNGPQHYEDGHFYKINSNKKLSERQTADELRRQQCKKYGIKLIEIDGRKSGYYPRIKHIEKEIKRLLTKHNIN